MRTVTDDPTADVVCAWTTRGVTTGRHIAAVEDVRDAMPELAAALDRLAKQQPAHRGAFWHPPED